MQLDDVVKGITEKMSRRHPHVFGNTKVKASEEVLVNWEEIKKLEKSSLKNAIAEAEHVDFHNGLEKQIVIAPDGTDITETVEKAVAWLTEHSF